MKGQPFQSYTGENMGKRKKNIQGGIQRNVQPWRKGQEKNISLIFEKKKKARNQQRMLNTLIAIDFLLQVTS